MSRIEIALAAARSRDRKGFIPFVTAGDPDLKTSLAICLKLAELGADVIEIGVPFSDPMADGPTIQRSSQRALENGVALTDVLELARSFRTRSDVPVVLFSYLNPVLSMGIDTFAEQARIAGIDGVLFTDVVDAEAAEISEILAQRDIDLISLIAPTTSEDRLQKICSRSRGFIYAVSRAGVTGAQANVSDAAEKVVARARKFTDLPVAVGFGVSTPQQVADVWRFADAAVVGSAIVAEIEKHPYDAVAAAEKFVSGLLPAFANAGS
jgi:tryptophan synthase alpha chain